MSKQNPPESIRDLTAEDFGGTTVRDMAEADRGVTKNQVVEVLRAIPVSRAPRTLDREGPPGIPRFRVFRRDTKLGRAQMNFVLADPRLILVSTANDEYSKQPVVEVKYYELAPILETDILERDQIVPAEYFATVDFKSRPLFTREQVKAAEVEPDQAAQTLLDPYNPRHGDTDTER